MISRHPIPRLFLLVVATVACACGGPPPAPEADRELLVAVLAFEVRGQDEGADYVGRIFAESLASNLEQAQGIRVERLSVRGATRVLTGTVTRSGKSDSARVRLIDAEVDEPLWETQLLSETEGLAKLSARVAGLTAEQLGLSVPELYGYIGDDDTPEVVEAWTSLLAWDAHPASELLLQLRERLEDVDRVAPASPYSELLRAYVYRTSGEPDHARELYTRVLARTDLTRGARAWALRQRSYTYLQIGNPAAARVDAAEAVALDPANALSLDALSKALEAMDRLDDAIVPARQAITLEPFQWRHHQRLGILYARVNRFDEALVALELACELSESQEACANVAVALQRAGRHDDAMRAAEFAEARVATGWGLYNLACFHALAGEKTTAVASLRRAAELGFADAQIDTDSDLDSLRGDSAFEGLVAEIGERVTSRRQLSDAVFPWQ